jgi:hypothetical protein
MLRKSVGCALALLLCSGSAGDARDRHKERERDRAIGAAIGLAIVGIAAASGKHRRVDSDGLYDRRYDGSYAAAPDVVCYRNSRQCYRRGFFSGDWTHREFGYDPYRRGY